MQKVLVCNVGWMKEYRGITEADPKITGGGSDPNKGEVYNFQEHNGRVYGYVQVKGRIDILKHFGASSEAERVENVAVFWVAHNPQEGGTWVVGWYLHATVYRNVQKSTGELEHARRVTRGGETWTCDYNIVTTVENSRCLPEDERTHPIPRGSGGLGRQNIRYPEGSDKDDLLKLVAQPWAHSTPSIGMPKQLDVSKRLQVEESAVEAAAEWYTSRGFSVHCVSMLNKGWDLEAVRDESTLHIEVKGLSGGNIAVELTPNEYNPVKSQHTDYRLCVVTNALEKDRVVHVFHIEEGALLDQDGHKLKVQEMVGARLVA